MTDEQLEVERGDTVVRRVDDVTIQWTVQRVARDLDTGETIYVLGKDSSNPDIEVLTAEQLQELYRVKDD